MKKKCTSQSAPARRSPWLAAGFKRKRLGEGGFFNIRVLIAALLCVAAVAVALLGMGAFSSAFAQKNDQPTTSQDAPGTQTPDVVQVVGPVAMNQDLRTLPYIPQEQETEKRRLTRYQFPGTGALPSAPETSSPQVQSLIKGLFRAVPLMPPPQLTFEGGAAAQFCACAPPDSDGDVGPNHYVEAINNAFAVYDKNGNMLAGPTTYNTLFAGLPGPCGAGQNQGDPFVLYDHVADRWLISDFAFPGGLPGSGPFWQCIAVSQTSNPVAGGWFLYAIQHEPAHPTWVGDYPKFALWNNPQPGGAYHFTVNLFDGPTLAFEGVRTFALDRAAMLAGTGTPNPTAVAFTIPLAGVGDSYSLVAANFRTGSSPPAGRDEMLLAVDAAIPGATLTHVHGWLFHVDFVTPTNSTIGIGANHTPNAQITVDPFVQAWTASTYRLVPQQGTADKLDTLGDKIMTPLVYQNRNGTESLWAQQTVMLNFPNGPTAIDWYQFNVTGGNFPATPVQQQIFTNGNDGLFRWMGSIAVDQNGDTAIGYSVSNSSMFSGIRYAGRLSTDPLNDLGQGEANMFSGTGSQTGTDGRWGDYSMNTIDPADGISFWHVNEYYENTSSFNWHTRIGKFQFPVGPTPTPTATAAPSPTPTATATPTPTPTATVAPSPTPTATATPTSTPTATPTPTATVAVPPIVFTNSATNVASSSAKLNGTVNPNGLTTTVRFQYGKTTSYGSTTASQTKTGNTYQSVSSNVSGLTANTTYHFRIVATNSSGTRFGTDRTFTTTGPPVVTTNPATSVARRRANLNGTVDPNGLTTTVHFQYGKTTSYGSTTASQIKTGTATQNVTANISGLKANTTYHFRIVATNSSGTRSGSDKTFRTRR
jgi:hypothetical protein